jgi:hypothetical protein
MIHHQTPSFKMPRLPIDYSKTLIYKIVCNDLSILECYVGHTTDFTRSKSEHKRTCNNEKGKYYYTKVYTTIRENGGWICWRMIETEKYPCKDINEATAKERECFERLNSNLNTQHPNRSVQEYHETNRDEIRIQQKQYYAASKEEVAINKRQYNSDHKEEIATRRRQTFTCECGEISTWDHKSRHLKTKFHLQYMESIMLTTIPVVPPITDTQLVRGICYIPLAQFGNIKQQEQINDDHFSNHYDYMHQQ